MPDLEAAQREALKLLADMAKGLVAFPDTMAVEVRDEVGPVLSARVVFKIGRTN